MSLNQACAGRPKPAKGAAPQRWGWCSFAPVPPPKRSSLPHNHPTSRQQLTDTAADSRARYLWWTEHNLWCHVDFVVARNFWWQSPELRQAGEERGTRVGEGAQGVVPDFSTPLGTSYLKYSSRAMNVLSCRQDQPQPAFSSFQSRQSVRRGRGSPPRDQSITDRAVTGADFHIGRSLRLSSSFHQLQED